MAHISFVRNGPNDSQSSCVAYTLWLTSLLLLEYSNGSQVIDAKFIQ